MELTTKETVLLFCLRNSIETKFKGWGLVYLDTVKHPFSPREFAGILSSLTNKDLYRPLNDPEYSDSFGSVKINQS